MRSLNEGTHQRVAALDGVGAGVVEFGGGDFQREEIAVDAVTVTFWMEKRRKISTSKNAAQQIFSFFTTHRRWGWRRRCGTTWHPALGNR